MGRHRLREVHCSMVHAGWGLVLFSSGASEERQGEDAQKRGGLCSEW